MRTDKIVVSMPAELSANGASALTDKIHELLIKHMAAERPEIDFSGYSTPSFFLARFFEPDDVAWSSYTRETRDAIRQKRRLFELAFSRTSRFWNNDPLIVSGDGRMSKRIAKAFREKLGFRLTSEEKSEIGNTIYLNTVTGEYSVALSDGTFIRNMKRGKWGDDDSCFYGGYENNRLRMANNDGHFSVMLVRSGGKDGDPYARCWVYDFTDTKADGTEVHTYLPFNTYSKNGAMTTKKMAFLLSAALDGYKAQRLSDSCIWSDTTRSVYINESHEVIAVSTDIKYVKDIYQGHEFKMYTTVDERLKTCGRCSGMIDTENDRSREINGETICMSCADSYRQCRKCRDYHFRSDMIRSSSTSSYYCSDCYEQTHEPCTRCATMVHRSRRYHHEGHDGHYCSNCHEITTATCHTCSSRVYLGDVHFNHVTERNNCTDCIVNEVRNEAECEYPSLQIFVA